MTTYAGNDVYPASVTVPDDGDDEDVASILVAVEGTLDRTTNLNAHKAPIASPTFTGTVTLPDTVLPTGKTLTCAGGSIVDIDGGLNIDSGGSFFPVNGSHQLNDVSIDLSDADHTLDLATGGQMIRMLTAPAANRILTLRQSSTNTPPDGYWFEVTVLLHSSHFTVSLQRQGSGDYVAILGDGVGTSPWGNSQLVASVRVKKIGGVWKLDFAGAGPVFYAGDS